VPTVRIIENPIINSPFEEPKLHHSFDDEGITPELAEGRRPSIHFIPIPRPKKRGGAQLDLNTQWTNDRIVETETNKTINRIRERVALWRQGGHAGVTPVTRRLLEYWCQPERDKRLFFCQIEALETLIYLTEVASRYGDTWIEAVLRKQNEAFNETLPRIALKMATGSGKTVVMAMIIAYHTLNKIHNPQNKLFSDAFLIVAPGITIRDRLRVLLPESQENYYKERDLLPDDLFGLLPRAKIVITNFHTFLRRETMDGVPTLTKRMASGGDPDRFKETPAQVVRRVCRELGNKSNIVVINDEAHHCYLGRHAAAPNEGDDDQPMTAEERREAEKRDKAARVWFEGLKWVHKKLNIRSIYDLSATPFFLQGSGYGEGTLFPWVVSDFALVDAIEAGIVKIPRVPIADNTAAPGEGPIFRNLWPHIKDDLPKKGRSALTLGEPRPPAKLEAALKQLYAHYEKTYKAWKNDKAIQEKGLTPPVFIVVCNNTSVSKMVYDFIGGWERNYRGKKVLVPGDFPIFSNVDDKSKTWRHSPNTILVDSEQIESGEVLSKEFKEIAKLEIDEFKDEYRRRHPGSDADEITDGDILREAMNTVGKKGKLGENIRCVVSVSMLTEGWDANTVTHILGIRAFGTQLLCEQVIGRGLRRRSYAITDGDKFVPEYAEVYGVPFSFIPTAGHSVIVNPGAVPTRVRALQDRIDRDPRLEIQFPMLEGYRYELAPKSLNASFNPDSRLVLSTMDIPSKVEVATIFGQNEIRTMDELRACRVSQIDFRLAKEVLERHLRDENGQPQPWLFPQILGIVRRWREEGYLVCNDDTFPQLVLLVQKAIDASERIYRSIAAGDDKHVLIPRLRQYSPVGTTKGIEFDTLKPVMATDPTKCHLSHVVADTQSWEQKLAGSLEDISEVKAYVKNERLNFLIPYEFNGDSRNYMPDFIVKIDDGHGPDDLLQLIVEVTGEKKKDKEAKVDTARNLWVPAVNNSGAFGRWDFIELREVDTAKVMIRQHLAERLKKESVNAA
jgi:type III restriction enzyme